MKHAQTLRQILVITGLTLCSVTDGLIFGQMSGMIRDLHGGDEINLDDDIISWIASVINITCFCGFALTATLTNYYGRRKSLTIVCLLVLFCWILVYFARDKVTLLISRLIVGFSYGGILLLLYTNVGEYVSPKFRSLALNITCSIGLSAGTMFGHILSIFMHWRKVALVCMIPTIMSAVTPLFWVESPSWLATKHRFEESERSFKALHGTSEASDKELEVLIQTQKAQRTISNKTLLTPIIKYVAACKQRYYWKTSMLIIMIGMYRVAAGRVFLSTLALTLIQEIAGTSDILLFTLIVDGFILLGSVLACALVSKFKMRVLLFSSGTVANTIQIMLAFCLYFWPEHSDSAIVWLKISLLAIYFIIVTAGPYAVLETLLAELHPLDIKGTSMFILSAILGIMQAINIQISIKMSLAFGYHGVFFLNSIVVFMCLLYLYFYLPETKGRTLQEIEQYFKLGAFKNVEPLLSGEKMLENVNRYD